MPTTRFFSIDAPEVDSSRSALKAAAKARKMGKAKRAKKGEAEADTKTEADTKSERRLAFREERKKKRKKFKPAEAFVEWTPEEEIEEFKLCIRWVRGEVKRYARERAAREAKKKERAKGK